MVEKEDVDLDLLMTACTLHRHSSTKSITQYFATSHLRPEQRNVVQLFQILVLDLLNRVPSDTPELTAGLRKLLEAKDCMVRASLPSSLPQ